jgi:S1-C subfamily serine protease
MDKSTLPYKLPYLISDKEAELGEGVYTLGYPRQDVVFGEGSISAQSGYLQNPNAYQISVPVNPGNSGGPLFNAQGNLVGMISGLQTQTYGTAFATKSSTLRHLIDEWEAPPHEKKIILPTRNSLKNLSRVEQVKRWKNFVFVVEVYN